MSKSLCVSVRNHVEIISYLFMARAMHDQVENTLVKMQNCLHKAAWRIVVNEVLSE